MILLLEITNTILAYQTFYIYDDLNFTYACYM